MKYGCQKHPDLMTYMIAFYFLTSLQSCQKLNKYFRLKIFLLYSKNGKYELIVSAERRIKVLDEHLFMWEQYEKHKVIRRQLDKMKPGKKDSLGRSMKQRLPFTKLPPGIWKN